MSHAHYEEVQLTEMTLSDDGLVLNYPCPCGDIFELSLDGLAAGGDIAQCPTCSLTIKVLFSDAEKNAALGMRGQAGAAIKVSA